MHLFRKSAISLAALTVVAAPVAASATPVAANASSSAGESRLEGNSSWIIGLIGLLAGVTVAILATDDDDDSPVSP
ncbi:MAG TPA: hypothetical protein VJM13_03765 [Sphingopyxis sp.]|nr:hypothetical protein [Sphingopyxis sp.]